MLLTLLLALAAAQIWGAASILRSLRMQMGGAGTAVDAQALA
jgi:hypothetical protein